MKNWIQNLPFMAGMFCVLSAQAQVNSPTGTGQNISPPDTVVYLSQEENRFYQTINHFRTQLNLPALQIHVDLQNSAQKFSAWLASTDFLTHFGPAKDETPFQRMEQEGYTDYTYAGENIACGNGDAIATFRQFAFSPDHLDNMISPHYHHVGISRSGTGNEGCPFYWVNDFGSETEMNQDQPDVTDLNLIAQAIVTVSGPLNGNVVVLPPPDPSIPQGTGTPVPIQVNPNPVPVQSSPVTPPSSPMMTPTPFPTPVPTNAGAAPASTENTFSIIQCMIPYRLGKGLFAFSPNVDTVLNVLNTGTGYNVQLTFFENGELANIASSTIYGVDVVKSAGYPLFDIFSAPGPRVNGFIIEFDSQRGTAQFTPYLNNGAGAAGTVDCSVKY